VVVSFLGKTLPYKELTPESWYTPVHYGLGVVALLAILQVNVRGQHRVDAEVKLLRGCIGALALWFLVVAPFQENWPPQLAGALLFAFQIYIALWRIPQLATPALIVRIERLAVCIATLCLASSALYCLAHPPTLADRFAGVFESVSVASSAFAFSVLVFAARIVVRRDYFFSGPMLLIAAFLLVLTRTRAWIAAVILTCWILTIIITRREQLNALRTVLGLGLPVCALAIGAFAVAGAPWVDDLGAFLRMGTDELSSARTTQWQLGLETIRQRPWIGYGIAARQTLSADAEWWAATLPTGGYTWRTDPHNSIMFVALAGGYPAALVAVAAIVILVRYVFRTARRLSTKPDPVGVLTLAWILTTLMVGFFEASFLSFGNLKDRILWLCLGLVIGHALNRLPYLSCSAILRSRESTASK
jgi:O-antigen ligase